MTKTLKILRPPRTFQDLVLALQNYWAAQGCVLLHAKPLGQGAQGHEPEGQ